MIVCVPVHDRPDLLRACLASLTGDFTLVLSGDAPSDECRNIAAARDNVIWINCLEHKGAWAACNRALGLRRAGEDFCRVDSDTVVPAGWLESLQGSAYDVARAGTTVTYFRGYVCDVLGGFRGYGTYGGEDLDYLARAQGASYSVGFVSANPLTPPESNKYGPRRELMDQAVKALKRREPLYVAGRDLYEPV